MQADYETDSESEQIEEPVAILDEETISLVSTPCNHISLVYVQLNIVMLMVILIVMAIELLLYNWLL